MNDEAGNMYVWCLFKLLCKLPGRIFRITLSGRSANPVLNQIYSFFILELA